MMRPRVIMEPARSPPHLNKYIDIVVRSLEREGIDVIGSSLLPRSAGAVHIHWPEHLFQPASLSGRLGLCRVRARTFLRHIDHVRSMGGRLVWTVHNLEPHRQLTGQMGADLLEFESALLQRLDVFASLTDAGVALARDRIPGLRKVPAIVARHPHYRSIEHGRTPPFCRSVLGLSEEAWVIGIIGVASRYKGVIALAEAFSGSRDPRLRLFVAGAADVTDRLLLGSLAAKDPRIVLRFEHLSDAQVVGLHRLVDAVAFNGGGLNSGSIVMALSQNLPLIAPMSAVNAEMARLVGPEWTALFTPPLSSEGFQAAVETLRSGRRESVCPMDAFAPSLGAKALAQAYFGDLPQATLSENDPCNKRVATS